MGRPSRATGLRRGANLAEPLPPRRVGYAIGPGLCARRLA